MAGKQKPAGKAAATAPKKSSPTTASKKSAKNPKSASSTAPSSIKPKPGKSAGRPSSFTDEVKSKILTAIAAGNSLTTSAQYAGINYETLRLWLKRGEHGEQTDPEYFGFFGAVKKAEADAEALSIGRIRQAAKGGQIIERTTITTERTSKNGVTTTTTRSTERYSPPQWQADAWWCERKNPTQWGRNDRVTKTSFNFNLENLTDAQFEMFDQLTRDGVDPAIAYATCLGEKN